MVSSLTNPQALYQAFAYNGDKNTILDTPSGVDPQLANIQDGFPQVTQVPIENGGIPPERKDFNGLGYMLSSFALFSQNGGQYTFRADVSSAIGGYPLDAILWYFPAGQQPYMVRSLIANNTYNFADTPSYIDNVHWEIVDFSFDVFRVGDIKTSLQTSNYGSWFVCNGQAISRTTYSELFDLIGTTYGSGDGSTTFNLPDFTNVIQPTASKVDVKGNGITLGLTNGASNSALWQTGQGVMASNDSNYGTPAGTTTTTASGTLNYKTLGLTTDATKSGIEGSISSYVQVNWFIKVK